MLNNFTVQPDPDLWGKIEKTLRRRAALRRWGTVATGTTLVAAIVLCVVLLPLRTNDNRTAKASSVEATHIDVAMATSMSQPSVSSVVVEETALPTTRTSEDGQSLAPSHASEDLSSIRTQPTPNAPVGGSSQASATTASANNPQPVPSNADRQFPTSAPAVTNTPNPPNRATTTSTVATGEELTSPAVAYTEEDTQSPTAATPNGGSTKSPTAGPNTDTILWLPNAFAPGSDDPDINLFRPRLNKPDESISNYRMTIFNRSGHQVFYTDNLNQGWDGTHKGQPLPQAAYVYIIYYTDRNHLQHQRKGTITLLR